MTKILEFSYKDFKIFCHHKNTLISNYKHSLNKYKNRKSQQWNRNSQQGNTRYEEPNGNFKTKIYNSWHKKKIQWEDSRAEKKGQGLSKHTYRTRRITQSKQQR